MLPDFNAAKEIAVPNPKGGEGNVFAKLFVDNHGKAMLSRLPKGSSIGMHTHSTSDDINFVIGGTGNAICDGIEESLGRTLAISAKRVRQTAFLPPIAKIRF
jgi:quercetin dioxygenase-like cupin family protein